MQFQVLPSGNYFLEQFPTVFRRHTVLIISLSLVGVARSLTDFQYCCALDKQARVFIDEDGHKVEVLGERKGRRD
jgi:hypothetical protein